MTNPISNTMNVTEVTERVDKNAADTKRPEQAPVERPAADQVTLTSDAQRLGRVLEASQSEPEVDTAKVEALREAIQSGRFTVDSGRIADALLEVDSAIRDQ
ncbi:MAG: flagellar biosynthesis anti-sigma factor FlgM [Xanthomonadales bacterium]|nr:flagellar biosynthesis anti-sigma factor FlgM [Xanthomonadales bacterium]